MISNNLNLKNISLSDIIKMITTIVVLIGTVTFFIYKTQELPPRVDKLEQNVTRIDKEVGEIKNELTKSSVKQDIILEDLKIVKAHLLGK